MEDITNSATAKYKFQLRGTILLVAFQLFGVLLLYVLYINYSLIKNSLTPLFWAILVSIALHQIKQNIVNYLIDYDSRLSNLIKKPLNNLHNKYPKLKYIPKFLVEYFYRCLYVWLPIWDDVKRGLLSETIKISPKGLTRRLSTFMSTPNIHSLSPEHNYTSDSGSITPLSTKDKTNFNDITLDPLSPLPNIMDKSGLDGIDDISSVDSVDESVKSDEDKRETTILKSIQNKYSRSSRIARKIVSYTFTPFFIGWLVLLTLCYVIVNSDVAHYLGLRNIIIYTFLTIVMISIMVLFFVLLPKWDKMTYNVFVVIFILITLVGVLTLTTGVILFKIVDDTTRFVHLINTIVNNSKVYKDLKIDILVNTYSKKFIQSITSSLPDEYSEDVFMNIIQNDHINWAVIQDIFYNDTKNITNYDFNGYSAINISNSDSNICEYNYINDMFCCYATMNDALDGENGGYLSSLMSIFSFDFVNIHYLMDNIDSNFITTAYNMIIEYIDIEILRKIWSITGTFTKSISTNVFSILTLLISIGSWFIHLGIDFMVFLVSLYYLLLDSDSIVSRFKKTMNFVPSATLSNSYNISLQNNKSFDFDGNKLQERKSQQFFNSLFNSISDIFIVTFNISILHGFTTWFTFTIFGVDFGFITAFLSSMLSIIPYFPPWFCCLPAVIYLLYQSKYIYGISMLLIHMSLLWIDPILYEKIENSHPYLTGLSIVLGLAEFGLNGVIIGPLLICVTSWCFKVASFYLLHFATFDSIKDKIKIKNILKPDKIKYTSV